MTLDATPPDALSVTCARPGCNRLLVSDDAEFCSNQCRQQTTNPSKSPIKGGRRKTPVNVDLGSERDRENVRRGPGYRNWVRLGGPAMVGSGVPQIQVADLFNVDASTVSRWHGAWIEGERKKANPTVETGSDAGARALEDFALFRARYFKMSAPDGTLSQGMPYLTPKFHEHWKDRIVHAIETGGRLLILSPPRHGKTEFLIHVAIWLICRNPNIRILWVGLNDDIAQQTVDLIREELTSNTLLMQDFASDAELEDGFKPQQRSGRPWSGKRFTVATRTIPAKSPTVVAVGRGASLLSRDADMIIMDDIIDLKAVLSPTQRETDREWIKTQVGSRKMEHTAMIGIGSRQHADDIWRTLRETGMFECIIESSHDPGCMIDRNDHKAHDNSDCMLFPELRSHRWDQDQRKFLGEVLYEMVMLNEDPEVGARPFTKELLELTKDITRPLGALSTVPGDVTLIGGLDPASSGYQAACLTAFQPSTQKRFIVDMANDRGVGIQGWWDLVQDWLNLYGCRLWVVEANAVQSSYFQFPGFKEWADRNHVQILPHHTGKENKWDPIAGVIATANLIKQGLYSLPYADPDGKRLTDQLHAQWLRFDGSFSKPKGTSDLAMAVWFPETYIRNVALTNTSTTAKTDGWTPTGQWYRSTPVSTFGRRTTPSGLAIPG